MEKSRKQVGLHTRKKLKNISDDVRNDDKMKFQPYFLYLSVCMHSVQIYLDQGPSCSLWSERPASWF